MSKLDDIIEQYYHRWVKYGYYGSGDDLQSDKEFQQCKEEIERLILEARIDELEIILKSKDAQDWAGQMANAVGTVAKRYNKLTKQLNKS